MDWDIFALLTVKCDGYSGGLFYSSVELCEEKTNKIQKRKLVSDNFFWEIFSVRRGSWSSIFTNE